MASKVASAAVELITEVAKTYGIEDVHDKAIEFFDNNIRDPRLIGSIEEQIRDKYGDYPFYNDICAYIDANNSIERVINMLSDTKTPSILSRDRFAEESSNDFYTRYTGYSSYDRVFVKGCFAFIYDEVRNKVVCLNAHSDAGKVQLAMAMGVGQLSEEHEKNNELMQSMNTMMQGMHSMLHQIVNAGSMTSSVKDDFGKTSAKVTDFLKKIEDVGNKDNPLEDSEKALSKYQELAAEALFELKGEDEAERDKVICAIRCHMAVCYGNLGNVEKAFACIGQISPEAAKESKLYQFVKAALIINYGLNEKYTEAEKCLESALELEPNHRRAYLLRQYLRALQKFDALEEILKSLDAFFEKTLHENKEIDVIADYYIYRGFICKEFKNYNLAEKDFLKAKEFGYDAPIIDYNLALLYYDMVTQMLPKDKRLFCVSVDVSMLNRVIELLRKWLVEEESKKVPAYIKSRMVGVYVSSCVLLGIKHELYPLDEYLELPDLEYEVVRMLIMGADNSISKTTLSMLDEDDALYARIASKINDNQYDDVKKSLLLMTDEERKALPITTIYLILQASIANQDLEIYQDFRKYIEETDSIGLIECIDAFAKEVNGEVESAKTIVDRYAISSDDYRLLRNIASFYARNGFNSECEQLLVRILELFKIGKVYIDDKKEFYEQAITFLVRHKSIYTKDFVDVIDIENEQMWKLKAYFYEKIEDVPHLLEMLSLLYQVTQDYSIGFNEIVCLMKLMEYEKALSKATNLLATVYENNVKDRIRTIWMISNLHLFLGQDIESYEWAKKAHELTIDTPSDASHNAYLTRALRVGRGGESLVGIKEYKERHPVVISEWLKEVEIPVNNSGEEIVQAMESAVGHSHEEYSQKEKKLGNLYRKGILPNSTILKRHGGDIAQLFIFAQRNKLRISHGNWSSIEEKKNLIGDHILVDAVTLIVMQRYGCLDALKGIKNIHLCFASLAYLQEKYLSLDAGYVEPIFEWIKNADNVIFEPDGFQVTTSMSEFFSDEIMTCCRVASRLRIPFLTYEILVKDIAQAEKIQILQDLQVISLVALCYATMGSAPDKLSQMIFNLLEECTFINFTSETIVEQIKRSNYIISEDELSRFFICNTSCDMISFANVYMGVVNVLKDQHYSASLEFSRIVLENALKVWRRGTHYRSMSQYHNVEKAADKVEMISAYLYYLAEGIKRVYGTVPGEIEGLLGDVVNKSIHDISQKVIAEMADAL